MNTLNTDLCRLCLRREGSVQSVFAESCDLSITLAEIINTFVVPSAHITKNDGYTDSICTCCFQKVLDFYQFKLDIETNQVVLKTGNGNDVETYTKCVHHLEEIPSKELLIKEEDDIKKEVELSLFKLEDLHHEIIIDEDELKEEQIIPSEIVDKSDDGFILDKNMPKDVQNTEETYSDDDIQQEVDLSSLNQNQENTEDNSQEGLPTDKLISEDDLSTENTTINNAIPAIPKDNNNQVEIQFESSQRDETSSNQNEDNKIFKCKKCDRIFKRKCNLVAHLLVHSGETLIQCKICLKNIRKSNLNRHLIIHSSKKFECEICHKRFTQNRSIQDHLLTHSGKKPYNCVHCDKSFIQKTNLKTHSLIHTSEKPFKCVHCNKTFMRSAYLKLHLLVHTGDKPFKCVDCNKSFTQSSHLNMHSLIHSNKKPFKCEICNNTFRHKSNLTQHSLVHIDNKQFECDICNKTFKFKHNLKKHIIKRSCKRL